MHLRSSPATVRVRATLAGVQLRRLAATATVAALLSLQTVGNAAADPTLSKLGPSDCRAFEATQFGDVPAAWHIDRLQLDSAWSIATGRDVKVAVIDTGVSTAGTPYFDANRVVTHDLLGGWSEEDQKNGGMDCTHGTQVASLVAAGRPNGQQVDERTNFAGVAPDASIISYRVLSKSVPDGQGGDPLAPTITAVRHATSSGVDIINLSQSASPDDPLIGDFRQAVQEALAKNIVVVAAAGNIGQATSPSMPAAFDGVIAVGGTTATDAVSESSLPGGYISVGAPGHDITALLPSKNRESAAHTNQAYQGGLDGTSFAAPIVSGVVALMLERDPTLTPQEVKDRLQATADAPPSSVPDTGMGFGIINPLRALAGSPRPTERNPGADATVPVAPLSIPEDPDMAPAMVAVSVGAGALALASVGLVAAISIPAAVRRNRSGSGRRY